MSLAEEFARRGGRVLYLMRDLPGNVAPKLQLSPHDLMLIPAGEDASFWHGRADARATREAVRSWNGSADWVVVDHYYIDHEWERDVRDCFGSRLVIGGPPNRVHHCEMLQDQTFSVDAAARWADLVPTDCRLLLGPQYALLREEIVQTRPPVVPGCSRVLRVLVTLGGSDPLDVSSTVLKILERLAPSAARIELVIGPQNPRTSSLKHLAGTLTHEVVLHRDPDHMSRLIVGSDLVITGGGVSVLEVLCLGRPCIAILMADNQRSGMRELIDTGCCRHVDWSGELSVSDLERQIRRCLDDSHLRRDMAERGFEIVDGRGARRVVDAMFAWRDAASVPSGEL